MFGCVECGDVWLYSSIAYLSGSEASEFATAAASGVVDDESKAKKSAIKLAQSIIDAGVEVKDVPSEDEDGEAPEAKEVEAALDELEPGLTSYIDDNQDIIAKALADLLKGNEEIAAKVAALLAADEGERSGEAEEVADTQHESPEVRRDNRLFSCRHCGASHVF